MGGYDELISLLKYLLVERFMPRLDYTTGVLGDGTGAVQVPGRTDFAYARFNRGSSESFEIFNKTVPMVDGWPIKIGQLPWMAGLTQVIDTDWDAYLQSGWGDSVSTSNPHAPTHEWRDGFIGADPLPVYLRAIAPGRGYSPNATGTVVYVNAFEYHTGTIWPGTPGVDLAPIMSITATGTARFAGVYVSQSNTLGVVTGTTTVDSPVIEPNLVTFPFGTIPIARVRIYGGQAGFRESDFRDARQLFDFPPLVAATQAEVTAGIVDHKAVTPATLGGSARQKLTANRTYYVTTTGSDSNDGLSAGSPFLTIQKAIDTIATFDLGLFDVTIDVANGTYTGAVVLKPLITSGGQVTIEGDTATPSNVLLNISSGDAITASHQTGIYLLKGFRLQTSSSGSAQVYCLDKSVVELENIEFHTGDTVGAGRHLRCEGGGSLIKINTSYTITGNVARHYEAGQQGAIWAFNITVTCSGTRAFSIFAVASGISYLRIHGNTWTGAGSATGTRYSVTQNSVIRTDGATLPGDVAGTSATGGQYI